MDEDDDDDEDADVDISGPFKEALDSIGHDEDVTFNRGENDTDDDVTQRKRLFQGYSWLYGVNVNMLICKELIEGNDLYNQNRTL